METYEKENIARRKRKFKSYYVVWKRKQNANKKNNK